MRKVAGRRRATAGDAGLLQADLAGRYRLEHRAGVGPVATVYKAFDLRDRCAVAAKVIDPRYTGDPRFALRFREGLRRLAHVPHENLARLLDYGYDAGNYYLITEWVDGKDLADELSRGRALAPEVAVSIMRQACAALAQAHCRGEVHGGLKPQNILIGSEGRVKVTDCGLAGVIRETGLSKTRVLLSEAGYMAPERARGARAGPESDVYGLGVILFEMLTGRLPFEAAGAWSLLRKQAEDRPPQPSVINSDVPLDLSAVTMIALQKDRERRYPTAEAMGMALDEVETRATHPKAPARAAPAHHLPRGNVGVAGRRILAHLPRLRRVQAAAARVWPGLPALVPFAACFLLTGAVTIAGPNMARVALAGIGSWLQRPELRATVPADPTATVAVASAAPSLKVDLTGSVEAIVGQVWTISGRQVAVTGRTEIKGDPRVGDKVKVKALLDSGGALTAIRIERQGGRDGRGQGEGGREKVEFTGQVESMAPGAWQIAGMTVLVTAETELKGDIDVGDRVKVKARPTSDGPLLGLEIELED